MTRLRLVAALAAAGLAVSAAAQEFDPGLRDAPFLRGFWADAFNSGFKSTAQINSLISRAVTGRYNAIFVEVLAYHDRGSGGHGAYWNSAIVPKATDISGGIDPLAVLVSQAHANGLEVHAWIVPLRVSSSWPPNGNTLLAAHPEWLMVPQAALGGGPATVGGVYVLDPGSPDVQEYLASIVRELVTNYAIDGINLDYIRYTQTDAGYPASSTYPGSTLARYRARTGATGTPPASGNTAWNDWRRETISELVRRLRAEIPSIVSNPRQPLRFTADLICFGGAPANFTSSDAYNLHQNWKLWLEEGWLDAGMPMNYKREWNSAEAAMYRSWVNAALNWSGARHIYAGQANYLNPKAASVTQLTYVINAGAEGSCNYSYVGTANEDMNDTWESDWTWYSYVAANLFTSVVATPAMPWRSPATAVEGTVWGRVTDPDTGAPVDGATVTCGGRVITTDGNGYYVLTLVPAAPGGTTYTVTVTVPGCTTVNATGVVVLPGDIVRRDIRVCGSTPIFGDMDLDFDVDRADLNSFLFCLRGPDLTYAAGHFCTRGDSDGDRDVDLADFSEFQLSFTGP